MPARESHAHPTPPRPMAPVPRYAVPVDHGLTAVGLLMQLTSKLFIGLAVLFAMLPMMARGAPDTWVWFALGTVSVIRSVVHHRTGSVLLYGGESGRPTRAIYIYLAVAAAHALIVGMLLVGQLDASGRSVIAAALVLLTWPLAVALWTTTPWLQKFDDDGIPLPADMGFTGTAVLMTVFGAAGIALCVGSIGALLLSPGKGGAFFVSLLIMVLLLVRSVFHVRAGVIGGRGNTANNVASERYLSLAVASSFAAGFAVVLIGFMQKVGGWSLLFGGITTLWLLAWPLSVKKLLYERNFKVTLAGSASPDERPAIDCGLTALGWLLFGLALLSLSMTAAGIIATPSRGLAFGFSKMSSGGWLPLVAGALQLWAAFEILHMTPRYKMAAWIYAGVAVVITVYTDWPMLSAMFRIRFSFDSTFALLGWLSLVLTVPVATAVLVAVRKPNPVKS